MLQKQDFHEVFNYAEKKGLFRQNQKQAGWSLSFIKKARVIAINEISAPFKGCT